MAAEVVNLMPWLVLGSIGLLLALLIQGRMEPAALFTLWAVALHFAGLVSEKELLGGYTNPALVALLVLLMVSLALERSPLVDRLSGWVVRGGERAAVWRLSTLACALSAFLNNTAVVGGLMGVVTRQSRVAPSKLLIPLSYAAIVGGVITLVGTSTNLVVASLATNAGMRPLGMFEFTAVGLPVALMCVAVVAATSRWLPNSAAATEQAGSPYFLETMVAPGSSLIGRSIVENGLRQLEGLFLLEIVRNGRLMSPVGPDEVIEAHDHLIFTGEVSRVAALQRFDGLQVFGDAAGKLLSSNLVEVVIAAQSDLVNRTLREVDFRNMFDAGVVGIRRGERRLTGQLGRVELRVGDSLLLATGPDFRQRKNLARNFHLLGTEPLRPPLKPRENAWVLAAFAGVILLSALEWVPLLGGLLALLGLLLAARTLSPGELRRRFPFDLWMMVGSSLAIALALENSGAAALMAAGISTAVGQDSAWWALVGIYLMTWLLTELISNNAAAALVFPIALATARSLGVDPLPFVMVVAYAASAGFLLPFGYQTHLMVYTPGRYRTTDFLKAGWPVCLVFAAGVLLLVPVFFPF